MIFWWSVCVLIVDVSNEKARHVDGAVAEGLNRDEVFRRLDRVDIETNPDFLPTGNCLVLPYEVFRDPSEVWECLESKLKKLQ